ncbi:MAG: hypothetical protein GY778_05945 [bacterium]|nr:hypothetical protein [bacterium]
MALGGCAQSRPTLLVASLNIAHGRGPAANHLVVQRDEAERNLDGAAKVLLRERPDVVALQEVDAASAWSGSFDHLAYLQQAAGFAHQYHGLHVDKGSAGAGLRYGTALLADRPMTEPMSHAFRVDRLDTKGLVAAKIVVDGRSLLVASIHLDSKSAAERRAQVRQAVDVLGSVGRPMVLMGDLNETWRDGGAVELLADGLGLRAHEPDAPGWDTWPSGRPVRRIDWILISPELEFVEYRVWVDGVSDHLGVARRIRWK